ncbi:MAG: hypothetical protein N3B01_08065, partial [Verrucomicrobiae bacterium]|nr:hypothetical protein [Verrucomicrobiae bacterium]
MKTVLLLADSEQLRSQFAELVGPHVNLVLVEPPSEGGREKFGALLATWLPLVDAVVVDAVSLSEATRWALEALAEARLREDQCAVVRLKAAQRHLYAIAPDWLVLTDLDSTEQAAAQLRAFFELRRTQAELKRAQAALERVGRVAGGTAESAQFAAASELLRYREALRDIGRVLGKELDER